MTVDKRNAELGVLNEEQFARGVALLQKLDKEVHTSSHTVINGILVGILASLSAVLMRDCNNVNQAEIVPVAVTGCAIVSFYIARSSYERLKEIRQQCIEFKDLIHSNIFERLGPKYADELRNMGINPEEYDASMACTHNAHEHVEVESKVLRTVEHISNGLHLIVQSFTG